MTAISLVRHQQAVLAAELAVAAAVFQGGLAALLAHAADSSAEERRPRVGRPAVAERGTP